MQRSSTGFLFCVGNPTFSEESKRDTVEFSVVGKWYGESVSNAKSGGSVLETIQTCLLVGQNGTEQRLDVVGLQSGEKPCCLVHCLERT